MYDVAFLGRDGAGSWGHGPDVGWAGLRRSEGSPGRPSVWLGEASSLRKAPGALTDGAWGEGSRAILGIWGWAWTFPLGHLSLGGGLSSGVCSQPLPESWPCQGPASVRLSVTWKVPRGNPPPPFSQECWGPSGDHGLSWRLGVSLATGAFPSSSVFLQVRPGSNGRAMLWRLVWEVPSPRSERLMTKTLPLTGSGTWPAWRRYPMCDLSRPILARVLPGQSQGTHIR